METMIQQLKETLAPMDYRPAASEEQIAEYEQFTKTTLPLAYREWLAFSNGGEIFVPGTHFFSVGTDEFSLQNQNSYYKNMVSLPQSFLIIGKTNFGDLICADLNTQEIVQWDHEMDEEFLRWNDFFAFLGEEINAYKESSESNG